MDPLTAALTFATAIVKLHQTTLEGMTPEQRIEYGKLVLADLQRWHQFFERLIDLFPHPSGPLVMPGSVPHANH